MFYPTPHHFKVVQGMLSKNVVGLAGYPSSERQAELNKLTNAMIDYIHQCRKSPVVFDMVNTFLNITPPSWTHTKDNMNRWLMSLDFNDTIFRTCLPDDIEFKTFCLLNDFLQEVPVEKTDYSITVLRVIHPDNPEFPERLTFDFPEGRLEYGTPGKPAIEFYSCN